MKGDFKMILKLFTKKDCPKCPNAKKLCANLKSQISNLKLEYYDIDTVDGMAEAAFYSVMSTPSIILFDKAGKELGSWRGEVPTEKAILNLIK
ncbi:MAG: thioredoxin family protein [Patescibacteria group bacterium]